MAKYAFDGAADPRSWKKTMWPHLGYTDEAAEFGAGGRLGDRSEDPYPLADNANGVDWPGKDGEDWVSFDYLRPGGADYYLRPGGTSYYLQPAP